MERRISALKDNTFDLLVVGGGIFGACAALDATQRGLSVALVEREDFCSASSAHSYKLIHGGMRYLQHADVSRIRDSSAARRTFLRIAPHLVHPQPVVVPTYGYGLKSKWAMRLAMALYDLLTVDRNQGIEDPDRQVPAGRTLSREEVLDRYPGLPEEDLTGAAVFCDGQMYNPPRLVLAALRSAVRGGAVVANYVEAVRVLNANEGVSGAEVRDTLDGGSFIVRSKSVINATGAHAEPLLRRSFGVTLDPPTSWSRDAYFIVDRPLVEGPQALALEARTADADALLDRGGRHLFLTPWRGHTLVGVWHEPYDGPPDEYELSREELSEFLGEINEAYPAADLSLDDVSLGVAGLIPFGQSETGGRGHRFGHHSRLVDHGREDGIAGLLTLIGVRFTTAPVDAVSAVDAAIRHLDRTAPPSVLDRTPLVGGDFDEFEGLLESVAADAPDHFGDQIIASLAHNYGSTYSRILELVERNPELGARIGSSHVLEAEVVHAVRNEMAETLADVVLRRTDLGTGGYPGRAVLRSCASRMGAERGWSRDRIRQEIDHVVAHYPVSVRARSDRNGIDRFSSEDWSFGHIPVPTKAP